MKDRHKQKLVIMSLVLFILFNAPVVLLFNSSAGFSGLPLIYTYLFIVWLGSAVVSFLIFKKFNE